jgi:hypothetical protein
MTANRNMINKREGSSLGSFDFTATFQTGTIVFHKIKIFPTNVRQYSDLTIMFTPRTHLPTGSLIRIKMPPQFPSLAGDIACLISGGI